MDVTNNNQIIYNTTKNDIQQQRKKHWIGTDNNDAQNIPPTLSDPIKSLHVVLTSLLQAIRPLSQFFFDKFKKLK